MEYFTVKEFAEKMKMSPHSVRNSILAGRIFAIRPGIGVKSAYKIPESELDRLQIAEMCRRSL